jgi:hypothetical protein
MQFKAASVNLLNLGLAVAAVFGVLVIGLVLSGLLDVDPNRPYGFLSSVARVLQAVLSGLPRASGY